MCCRYTVLQAHDPGHHLHTQAGKATQHSRQHTNTWVKPTLHSGGLNVARPEIPTFQLTVVLTAKYIKAPKV